MKMFQYRKIGFYLLLAVLLFPLTAQAGINQWSSIGPWGEKVWALAIDPVTPTTLYAGTSGGGVFKSTNSGGNRSEFNIGLAGLDVYVLAIDPVTPQSFMPGHGVAGFLNMNMLEPMAVTVVAAVAAEEEAVASSPQPLMSDTLKHCFVHFSYSWPHVFLSRDMQ